MRKRIQLNEAQLKTVIKEAITEEINAKFNQSIAERTEEIFNEFFDQMESYLSRLNVDEHFIDFQFNSLKTSSMRKLYNDVLKPLRQHGLNISTNF
jgi:hypothetical protein